MKNRLVTIVILLNYFVYPQSNSAFEIEFRGNVYFDNQKDSLNFAKHYGNWNDEVKEKLLLTPEKQIVLIKNDSIIIEEFPSLRISPISYQNQHVHT